MKRFVDKLRALWVLARAKEFVLFTCDDFKTSKGGNCWVSYGIDNKEYAYENSFFKWGYVKDITEGFRYAPWDGDVLYEEISDDEIYVDPL